MSWVDFIFCFSRPLFFKCFFLFRSSNKQVTIERIKKKFNETKKLHNGWLSGEEGKIIIWIYFPFYKKMRQIYETKATDTSTSFDLRDPNEYTCCCVCQTKRPNDKWNEFLTIRNRHWKRTDGYNMHTHTHTHRDVRDCAVCVWVVIVYVCVLKLWCQMFVTASPYFVYSILLLLLLLLLFRPSGISFAHSAFIVSFPFFVPSKSI